MLSYKLIKFIIYWFQVLRKVLKARGQIVRQIWPPYQRNLCSADQLSAFVMNYIIQIIFNSAYCGGFRITTFASNHLVNTFPHLFRIVLI